MGDLRVWPFSLGINLKHTSGTLVEIPRGFEAVETTGMARRGLVLAPQSDAWVRPPAPLRAVVFPRYVADAELTLEKLTAVDASTRLLADRIHLCLYSFCAAHHRFLRRVERTPFYALVYRDLASAKGLIEALLA